MQVRSFSSLNSGAQVCTCPGFFEAGMEDGKSKSGVTAEWINEVMRRVRAVLPRCSAAEGQHEPADDDMLRRAICKADSLMGLGQK